jgi:hypothetical protein
MERFRIFGLSSFLFVLISALSSGVQGFYQPFEILPPDAHASLFLRHESSDPIDLILRGLSQPHESVTNNASDNEIGIKEAIPSEYQDRYSKWKDQFLSTDFGQQQWALYANNKHFLLKITVSSDRKFGAGTGDYKWDDNGVLIGATITLGRNLDKGFPDPVYYPVMNSLSLSSQNSEINGKILASTKIAHEFGHVNSTAQTDGKLFQQQERLMSSYYKIFLNNGYNTKDIRLVKLAGELGRNPIEVWEDREYWGEANAMQYLVVRINKENYYCSVLEQIKRNVDDYAKSYEARFDSIAASNVPAGCKF